MGRRFYCDYCRCYIPKDITSRRTHNASSNHKNRARQYYESLPPREYSSVSTAPSAVDPIVKALEYLSSFSIEHLPPSLRPHSIDPLMDPVDWG